MTHEKKTLLRGAHVLDPASSTNEKKDILIEGERIASLGKPGSLDTLAKEVNCMELEGYYACPGFIDLNARFSDPEEEVEKAMENSSLAAAQGGFTSVALMPSNLLANRARRIESIAQEARKKSKVRVFPIGSILNSPQEEQLAEIGSQVEAGAIAIAEDRSSIMNAYLMKKALEYVKAFSVPVFSFPMDKNLQGKGVTGEGKQSFQLGLTGVPSAAEEIMVERDIILSRQSNTPLHFSSITSKHSLASIARAKKEGLPITAETHPPYFSLSNSSIAAYGLGRRLFPPLQSEEDREAILEAMADATLNAIASMHSPQDSSFYQEEVIFEELTAASISFETSFPLALDLVRKEKCSLLRIIEMLSYEPAKILGLHRQGLGTIQEGSPADLLVFDPEKEYTYTEEAILSKAKNSLFLGKTLKGRVLYTFVEGKMVLQSE